MAARPLRRVAPHGLVLVTLVLTLLALTTPASSSEAAAEPATQATPAERAPMVVDLITVGPGSYFYARYGHSFLCARHEGDALGAPGARCWDYGIPDREETFHMAWTSFRGVPSFVAVALDEATAIHVYRSQGRKIDRQQLPLSSAEAAQMIARMDEDVRTRASYAYHPYFANCTTQLRDRIDIATSGKLRPGRTKKIDWKFRDMAEEGVSGRLGELMLLALLFGAPTSDRVPTPWEEMFVPASLRDGVSERLGVVPVVVAEHHSMVLETSRGVGRIALFVIGLALLFVVRIGSKRDRLPLALTVVGLVLGSLALLCDVAALLVVWPEMRLNWMLLMLLPTDLALGALARRRPDLLAPYAKVRIGIAALLGVLELVGVISQPLLTAALLVVLPMSGVLGAVRARSTTRATNATNATKPANAEKSSEDPAPERVAS